MITAAAPPNQVFQPGASNRASTSLECAILSSMILILALFSGLMGAPRAEMVVIGARIYTRNPKMPPVSNARLLCRHYPAGPHGRASRRLASRSGPDPRRGLLEPLARRDDGAAGGHS